MPFSLSASPVFQDYFLSKLVLSFPEKAMPEVLALISFIVSDRKKNI